MSDHRIELRVQQVASRLRGRRMSRLLFAFWGSLAVIAVVVLLWQSNTGQSLSWALPALAATAVVALLLANYLSRRVARDPVLVARQIENQFPGLESRLLTALEQKPQTAEGQFGFLQEMVIQQATQHARLHPWESTVSSGSLFWSHSGSVLSLVVMCASLAALGMWKPITNAAIVNGEPVRVAAASGDYQVEIEPGNTEVERGRSLLVLARFANEYPAEISLSYAADDGASVSVAMTKSLDDPLFAGRITRVESDLEYRVLYGAQETELFRITVFEYPQL
ncbi:MAG: hypothetical protein ABGZ17_05200, partial [Planctomycetaceae bacterium]